MKEYIVTLKDIKDKESFCNDMVSNKQISQDIPIRSCNIEAEEKFSPNICFYLEDEEAENIKKDHRILGVEVSPISMGYKIENLSNYKELIPKNDAPNIQKKENEKVSSLAISGSRFAKIGGLPEGKDVDVVIMDSGNIKPNHPEFSGRVKEINWFSYANIQMNYTYSYIRNHPCHVAGIVAGNTNGWATGSNIYSISSGWASSGIWISPAMVVGFHLSKLNGNKNPTVVNMSFRWSAPNRVVYASEITRVNYRGQTINRPAGGFTAQRLLDFGILVNIPGERSGSNGSDNPFEANTIIQHGLFSTAYNAEISNMINNGLIVVAAAGNSGYKIDVPGGTDYNNSYSYLTNSVEQTEFYHRGGSPGAAPNIICVGALGATLRQGPAWSEFKSIFSETGPKVDVYAPGENIQSCLNFSESGYNPVADPRTNSVEITPTIYYLGKQNGTSMASPQVAGMIACRLQNNRNMNQEGARAFIAVNATNSMSNGVGSYENSLALLGGNPRVAFYPGLNLT